MKAVNSPGKFPIAWGSGAGTSFIRKVPGPSQQNTTPGAASYTDGYPPVCFQPVGSGGIPPFGQDMNGVLSDLSLAAQWANAGASYVYDSGFATAIGGYPLGAVLLSNTLTGFWLNQVDGNTSNPDANGAGWVPCNLTLAQLIGTGAFQQVAVDPELFVRSDGNDNNSGLSNTAAGAFATIAGALAKGTNAYNFASSQLTVQLGIPGSYAAPTQVPRGSGTILIQGDPANQANYILSGNGQPSQGCVNFGSPVNFTGLTISNAGSGAHVLAATAGAQSVLTNVTLAQQGTTSGALLYAQGTVSFSTGCILEGNAGEAIWSNSGGQVSISNNVGLVIAGNPTFSNATVLCSNLSQINALGGASVSGNVSGPRYLALNYGIITTNGGGANFFPGSSAGSTTSGGLYG